MPLTIPNSAGASFSAQAEPDSVDIDILVAALNGQAVVSGCAVTAQGTPNMTLAVAAGVSQSGGSRFTVTAANVTVTAANATNPRFDLVVIDSAGAKQVRAGTAAASPVFPTLTAGDVALCSVYVPANDTAIDANQLTDKRVIIGAPDDQAGPITLTGNTTLTDLHKNRTILVNAASGNITLTPPTAVGFTGFYRVKKIDVSVNTVTFDPAGAETVDTDTTFILTDQNQVQVFESTQTAWVVT